MNEHSRERQSFMQRAIGFCEDALMWLVIVSYMLILGIVTVDVAMRYLFNSPLPWSFVLVSNYLMVAAFFLSISYTQRVGGHIGVDLLHDLLPDALKRWSAVVLRLLGVLFVGLIAVGGYNATVDAYTRDLTEFGYIPWPTWLSLIFVPIGAGLFALRLALEAGRIALGAGDGSRNAIDDATRFPAR
jgi:TRAP-type C4-dicarboxylate transport system permease small subunit